MGHTRLGIIPKTRSWSSVVALFAHAGGSLVGPRVGAQEWADVTEGDVNMGTVADRTLDAARGALEKAKDDPGLQYTVFLLVQVALASRDTNWTQRLEPFGIQLDDDASLVDLTAELQGSIDDWLARRGVRSDISEMAQRAAGDALVALTAARAQTLFGDSGDELRLGLKSLSTKKGFGELGQAFFGRFMTGFLNFYLSRITAEKIGSSFIQQLGDLSVFNRALANHCLESARIVRDFAGQWYSKTQYERGRLPGQHGRIRRRRALKAARGASAPAPAHGPLAWPIRMMRPRLVLCSGAETAADDPLNEDRQVLALDALGPNANVNLRLEDVARVFLKHLNPRLVDLLEIAAYVYTADGSTLRASGRWEADAIEPWRRDFRIVIRVRDLDFWTRPDVSLLLHKTLSVLSDDHYSIEFQRLTADRPQQEYLQFSDQSEWPFTGVSRVCLFSGGLDSLSGALDMISRSEPLVLVSHRSVAPLDKRQRDLVKAVRERYPAAKLLHIPVWVNKSGHLGREFSQRTRSFLFSALGCAVAHSVKADGIRFFENGVVSLNLPVADEVLGARASRTTHPQVLHLFGELYSLVLDRPQQDPMTVDNPFVHSTKQEVVERIGHHAGTELISLSCSCAHTLHKSKSQWHCGTCSQCIDRRIAILAADMTASDPARDYVVDVFTGPRKPGYEQNMAVDYARHALELSLMDDVTIAASFNGEISRAVRHEHNRGEAAAFLSPCTDGTHRP